ncbi:hypothetical protein [Streptomyces sp. 5-10]|uniref:hypothetical protein n=1 Tax=Streptomyces sp. 5-10 TaxID=878925 RepID=UPI00168B86E2|nr:hypothetical protein [Streptomyces sp. 5-10]MBD3004876.1 hypothetical protein [Streptomyces sp. 5-10]
MNYTELKEILNTRTVRASAQVDAQTLGGSDRSLLLGCTCSRNVWHVYLKDGRIHRFVYREDKDVRHEARTSWPMEELVPDKRVYPEYSDAAFSRVLEGNGIEVPFARFDDIRYSLARAREAEGVFRAPIKAG